MRACKCPNCGANLKADDDREFMFCEFCGARIDLVDRRTVHTEHIIDEAKIKDAEAKVKNAENVSRIVNIFAAPVEEKQRQAEFERQRQLEADRREFEREQQHEQQRLEQKRARQAVAGGCAVALWDYMVDHIRPIGITFLLFIFLGGCMEYSNKSTAASSEVSPASSAIETSTVATFTDTSVITNHAYDYGFVRNGIGDSHQYWLISLKDNIICTMNTYSQQAFIFNLPSTDFSSGFSIDITKPSLAFQSDNLENGITVRYENTSYDFEPVDIDSAFTDLEHILLIKEFQSIE